MDKKILIAGFGSAGSFALEYLARTPGIEGHKIIVGTRSTDEALALINTIKVSAAIMGFYPDISLVKMDLGDVDRTAETLAEMKPDIIAYTARFIKGVKYGQYSYPNQIGYGAWIALSLPLIYKLMLAVKKSGVETKVINSSFPDGVCPALKSAGLEPFCGAGNLNHLVPRIQAAVAGYKKIPAGRVKVVMIGSHFLNTYVSREASAKGSPYYMRCTVDGEPFNEISDEEIFKLSKIPTASGPPRNMMIASDMVKIIQAVVFDQNYFMHIPGPEGLAGAYAARVSAAGAALELPADISRSRAEEINRASLSFDGIKDIREGRIYFCGDIIDKMKKIFGLNYPECIKLEECEAFAYEIKEALSRYRP